MKIYIFSGTSEGSILCRWLFENKINADIFVATEYGKQVLPRLNGINIHIGRLNQDEMNRIFTDDTLVIDATHPYAVEVTKNIKIACDNSGAEYLRLVRPQIEHDKNVICVNSTASAIDWLNTNNEKVLLTTGSKELEAYTAVKDYQNRLFVRVLPSVSVIEKCTQLGFAGSNIIAMQGPFSKELNKAMIKQTGASILVTKDTGSYGGFVEKQEAAIELGAKMLMIARPTTENGYNLEEIKREILSRTKGYLHDLRFPMFISIKNKPVLVVGAGNIANRRVNTLRDFGADVKIIAIENKANILGNIILKQYETNDIIDKILVVAATDDRKVNHQIYLDCIKMNIPVSVADCADESTFFFPAICKNKNLIAGIVSNGTEHKKVSGMAKKIRILMEDEE